MTNLFTPARRPRPPESRVAAAFALDRPSMSPPRSIPACARGFSLVETIVVLSIMAVGAAIAAPRYMSSISRYRVELAARRIAADLAMARATAKASSSPQKVAFTDSNYYTVTGVGRLDRRAGVYTVTLNAAPYHAATSSITFTKSTGNATITFDGFGNADRGVTVVLRSGGMTKSVVLNPDTGEATVQP